VGVTNVIVLESLNVTAAFFPPIVAVVPVCKPLPRIVIVLPPAAGAFEGLTVPMLSGALAS